MVQRMRGFHFHPGWRHCWVQVLFVSVMGGWLCGASAASLSGPRLLWITADVTTAARSATVSRLAHESGGSFTHLTYPLAESPVLDTAATEHLRQALAQANMVWIDAPHASIEQRLQRQLRGVLPAPGAHLVWVHPGRADDPERMQGNAEAMMAAHLQAGGVHNLRHALSVAHAVVNQQPLPKWTPPQTWPTRGIYHPDAPTLMPHAQALLDWCRQAPRPQGASGRDCQRPAVAVLIHRHHWVDGSTAWVDEWLRLFESAGLWAYAVFGPSITPQTLGEMLTLPQPSGEARPHPAVLVLHQFAPQAAAWQPWLARWGLPLLATQPFRAGSISDWMRSDQGLTTSDVPFYLAQPEAAGAIDPIVTTAQGHTPAEVALIERQAQAVVAKAQRLVALQTQPPADKRLVAMVYNYPPGGRHFGASFLNVPRSLAQVSAQLAQAGYHTQAVSESDWITGLQPLLSAYHQGADLQGLLASGQADAWPLAHYLSHWKTLPESVRTRIEAHWGPPERSRYVVSWQGEPVFVIPRMQVGHFTVLPQPPREETLYGSQNPFMHKNRLPLSHHYLAVYAWVQAHADALMHFGTHGTQEWANGKARGLDVHDDALLPLGNLPVIYPYIVDNLGEALTAKRRGRAVMVSHRTPPLAPAGFEGRMAHMHEVMHEWETVDEGPTRRALEAQLIDAFITHQLHRDLGWSRERITQDFSGFLEVLHPYLDQLAQSAQPRGLAVFGQVPDADLRRQTLLQMLRKPLMAALGEDIDEVFLIRHDSVAQSRPARWLGVALSDAHAASTLDLRPPLPLTAPPADWVRAEDHVPNRAARQPIDTPALFKLAEQAQAWDRLLATEGEMPGLLTALEGRFVPAAYGGDPVRNPESLPTGRNLTGLDPSRLPTRQAYAVAQTLFKAWFEDYRSRHHGQAPARLALSLWAGETLRHQGIMEAQALVALGVQPVWDDAGRPRRVEVLPLAELGRPRVDVLLSVTGSYRDQFPALMALLDQAVAQVTQAEPDNPIARHTQQVRTELRQQGWSEAQASTLAQVRAFGNASGDYGTGLSDAVQANGLQKDDARLGELFLQRMSQPYLNGEPVAYTSTSTSAGQQIAAQAFAAHLRRTDAALLSRSSHLYAMLSSDDPFQYLGGLSAAARAAGRTQGLELHVSQLQDVDEAMIEPAQRTIAREMQSRYLHPGWLAAQKEQGYAGTLQVLKAVQFAWGWQSIEASTVRSDHWQRFYEVLVQDQHRLGLPEWMRSHPQAYAQTLERLIQAQRHGHWVSDARTQQHVARLYAELTQADPLPHELSDVRTWVQTQQTLPSGARALSAGAGVVLPSVPTPAAPSPPEAPPMAPPSSHAATPVPHMGILLKRQADPTPSPTAAWSAWLESTLASLCMTLVVMAGAWGQRRRGGHTHCPMQAVAHRSHRH